jgi:peptide/nickel transport system permease protein
MAKFNMNISLANIAKKRFMKDKVASIALLAMILIILIAVLAPFLSPHDPLEMNYSGTLQSPSGNHFFGTDEFGRDVFSRILYGTRYALIIGLGVVLLESAIGVTLGILAGYFGGIVDGIIMRIVDIMLSIPSLILAIALAGILGGGLKNTIIAIGIIMWGQFARLVRGETLLIMEEPYIEAAKSLGISDLHIIFKHILPNALSPLIVYTTLSMPSAILISASLSFLGVGVQPPTPEWGLMVSEGRDLIGSAWWISTFPGLAIMMISLTLNVVGDALRDALDPKLEGRI